jgi:hypothetical protein
MLLRLYPRPFHEQFGVGMAQTFGDLCRERRGARKGLLGLAVWVYFETLAGIVRENSNHMTQLTRTVLRVALGALAMLMVPLVASLFIPDWHWGVGGFVFAYVMFFGTGMAYALIARHMGAWAYKAGVGLALATGFVMGWGSMVHMSESENPANLVYFGVLAVGAVGAWMARLEARGLSRALFAMAVVLALVGVVAVVLPWDAPSGPMGNVAAMHGLFVGLFAGAGLLFRQASLAGAK